MISVIVPTYNRVEQIRLAVLSLLEQQCSEDFEIVVVVDGCTDGTLAYLQDLQEPRVVVVQFEQNRGGAIGLNAGVRTAKGKILLFVDDDMQFEPGLIEAHLMKHRTGKCDVVMGNIPLGTEPADSFFRSVIYDWTEGWVQTFIGRDISYFDTLYSGHFSIRRELFERVGGFDETFSRWGRKDSELGHRLIKAGAKFDYCPDAIARQNYTKTPSQFLSDFKLLGQADVEMFQKHPELRSELLLSRYYQAPFFILALRHFTQVDPALTSVLTELCIQHFEFWHFQREHGKSRESALWVAADYYYWQGVKQALGGNEAFLNFVGQPASILLYHRIVDRPCHEGEVFSVSLETFREQMEFLRSHKYSIVPLRDIVTFLACGQKLPPYAVAITFDDGCQDVLLAAQVLKELNYPFTVFVPTRFIGKTNAWRTEIMENGIPLLTKENIISLLRDGVDIQPHGHSHIYLGEQDEETILYEVAESTRIIKALGGSAYIFAYPGGSTSETVINFLKNEGYKAGVTSRSLLASKDSHLFHIPRITVEEGNLEDFAMRVNYGIGQKYAYQEFPEQLHKFRPAAYWEGAKSPDNNDIYVYLTPRPPRSAIP